MAPEFDVKHRTRSLRIALMSINPPSLASRPASTLASMLRGRADRQRQISVVEGSGSRQRVKFELEKGDAPTKPAALRMLRTLRLMRSTLISAHTSRSSRVSRVCGTRESSWDARAPKSRPRVGRRRRKRIPNDKNKELRGKKKRVEQPKEGEERGDEGMRKRREKSRQSYRPE